MGRGLIVSGGHVNRDLLFKYLKTEPDLIVGVDGGMNPLWVVGAMPDYLLGDFDSCDALALSHFRKKGVPEVVFNSEKDMTDTELAICSLVEKGMDEAVILGATGSRIDHTLTNMMLLPAYSERISLTIINENNRIQVAKTHMTIGKDGYKYLSLLPLSDEVTGVTLTGVKYPLKKAVLKRETSFAVSNEVRGEGCELFFDEGVMLVIQSDD